MRPNYPIYIISKNRSESRYTSKALEKIDVPYKIVIEPQDYDDYAKVINPKQIIVLPDNDYGTSVFARNFVWEHSLANGDKRHWILDDNISEFYRLHNNYRWITYSGAMFKAAEDFTDRYTNVALSGFNYKAFCVPTEKMPPFYLNTRIYSCILIDNNIPYRWRGIYNEDTDLSIRVLIDGYCTILFNAFVAGKKATMIMKGGNTDKLYAKGRNSRIKMTESLIDQHPDIVKKTWKFNRCHHQVDYRSFKHTKLIKRDDLVIEPGINEYGMKLHAFDSIEDAYEYCVPKENNKGKI